MANSFQDALKIAEQRMLALWTTTPIRWDNVEFDPPSDAPWVSFHVLPGRSDKTDLINRYRSWGMVDVQVFVPVGDGSQPAFALADQIAVIWRSVTVGGIIFKTPSVQRVGDTQDGWYQVNLSVPFYWDHSF